jgi:hypothetical protein
MAVSYQLALINNVSAASSSALAGAASESWRRKRNNLMAVMAYHGSSNLMNLRHVVAISEMAWRKYLRRSNQWLSAK